MSRPTHITLASGLVLPADEVEIEFTRAGGPGGQNVNKVESKVVLRFPLARTRVLNAEQRELALTRLGPRLTTDGDLVLHCSMHRERARNVEEAFARLAALLDGAIKRQRKRRATKPTRGSQMRRLTEKRQRGDTKRGRRGDSD